MSIATTILLISLSFLPQGDPTLGTIQLIRTGQLNSNEALGHTKDAWYGLFETDSGFCMYRTNVMVTDSVYAATGGFYPVISTERPSDPLFLVRGIPNMSEGFVQTSFHGMQFVEPQEQLVLTFSSPLPFIFRGAGERDGYLYQHYTLSIFHDQHQQILVSRETAGDEWGEPAIIWAGDLDRDGRIDLLLELGGKSTSIYTLFLSSPADDGAFLKQVASFKRVGS